MEANEAARIAMLVGKWFRIKSENPTDVGQTMPVTYYEGLRKYEKVTREKAITMLYIQLAADAEHSSLLRRLLMGEEIDGS